MDIVPYLRHVNSMTKYPSIPTYHRLDPKNGMLLEEPADFGDKVVFCTEKIDGTNCRIIVFPDGDWLIGSREELLTARDDRIPNPTLGIVGAVDDLAEALAKEIGGVTSVFYLEVYGGGIGGQWKNYTNVKGAHSFRLFDVAMLDAFEEMLDWPIERVAAWRDGLGQRWASEEQLVTVNGEYGGLYVAPRILTLHASELPTSLEDTHRMLKDFVSTTTVAIGPAAPGKAEGLVMRTGDRSVIAKARFEDYARTLKRRKP